MRKPSLVSAILMGVCLAPLAAAAQTAPAAPPAADDSFDVDAAPATATAAAEPQYNNEWDFGLRTQNHTSATYGRYNGQPDSGIYPEINFKGRGGEAWDSDKTFFYEFQGTNLTNNRKVALPDSSASLKVGERGKWSVGLNFDNITYTGSTTFQTAYDPSGKLVKGVPAGISVTGLSLANPTTAIAASVSNAAAAILTTERVGMQRNSAGLSFMDQFLPNWTFTASFNHEHKTGTKENSLLQGSGAGLNSLTGNIVYFPEEVDYDTDRFQATLAYTTAAFQARLTYMLSDFKDNNSKIVLFDPFNTSNVVSNPKSATFAPPPSNFAHQILGQVGYNLSANTRLNATLGYGMQFQDQTFAPESTSPTVVPPAGFGASFDGKVQTFFGSAMLTARPMEGLDAKVSYAVDERNNRSPRRTFNYLLNDTAGFGAVTTNAPYSFRYQKFNAELGFQMFPQTRLFAGYKFEHRRRDYSAVSDNKSDIFYANLNTQLTKDLNLVLGATTDERRSTAYDGAYAWSVLGDNESTQIDAKGMKHYLEAPRSRVEYKGNLNWAPIDGVNMSVEESFFSDKYRDTVYGLTYDRGQLANVDMSYEPNDKISVQAFYTFEKTYYLLKDVVTPGGGGAPFYWTLGTPNTVRTAGASGKWQASSKLKVVADYTWQRGTTAFQELGGPSGSLGTSPWNYNVVTLPSNNTLINSFNLTADYQIKPTMTVAVGYFYEKLKASDYLYVQAPTSPYYANALLPGDGNPSYKVNVVRAAFRLKF